MRTLSVHRTAQQIIERQQTVTRRLWKQSVAVGELLNACRNGESLARVRVVKVTTEEVNAILNYPADEVAKNGYPGMSQIQFMNLFCQEMRCDPDQEITRIEFEYNDAWEKASGI